MHWFYTYEGPTQYPYTETLDEVSDEFFYVIFNQASHITCESGQAVVNDIVETVEVPVYGHITGNEDRLEDLVNFDNEEGSDGRRKGREYEDNGDESDKKIYDAAIYDNLEFDANMQFSFGRVGNTYLSKDFVAYDDEEEDSDTNSEKGFNSANDSSDEDGQTKRKYP